MHDLGDTMDATTTGTEDPHKGARNAAQTVIWMYLKIKAELQLFNQPLQCKYEMRSRSFATSI